jgi:Uma2 family endonuclease
MEDRAIKTGYAPEDLLTMPDGDQYELFDGALVERPGGCLAGWVAGRLMIHIGNHNRRRPSGWVTGGSQYLLLPDRAIVRRPSVSFVRFGRFRDEQLPTGYALLAPDLAAEVTSPDSLYEKVDQRIEEYVDAGIRLIWVISPENHTVRVYRADGSSGSLRENDELDGEDVLPGFRCPVRDLFPRPPGAPANGDAPSA